MWWSRQKDCKGCGGIHRGARCNPADFNHGPDCACVPCCVARNTANSNRIRLEILRGCADFDALFAMEQAEEIRASDMGWDIQCDLTPAQWIEDCELNAKENAECARADEIRRQWHAKYQAEQQAFDAAIAQQDLNAAHEHLATLLQHTRQDEYTSPPEDLLRLERVLAMIRREE